MQINVEIEFRAQKRKKKKTVIIELIKRSITPASSSLFNVLMN